MFALLTPVLVSIQLSGNEVPAADVFLYAFLILIIFLALFAALWLASHLRRKKVALSPYSKQPLRYAEDLSYYNMERVLRYLYDMQDYHNQLISFRRAAFCRETGRIFPDCIDWFGNIQVDWTFLQKKYPGVFVSWGSLTLPQQIAIRDMHISLEGFQTESSSAQPLPKAVEARYVFIKPGPLYVDINTYVLLGWKMVPGTNLEVLVVQRPKAQVTRFTPMIED